MIYVKSFLIGLLAAIVAAVIWIVAVVVLPVSLSFFVARFIDNTGGGGAGVFFTSDSVLVVALVGFVAGFVWTLRRSR